MTTPTGRLAWGQAGVYDAIDDRAVIRAVTRGRTGLTSPARVAAGTGLNLIITGGWLAVADCGDGTSAVVGTLQDVAVQANPGPPTGQRTDLVWCDVEPDEGTWALVVITAAESAGRPGTPLATIIVPANATLAAQMEIRPADSMLERRILGHMEASPTGPGNATTWENAPPLVWTGALRLEPGNWYRVRFTLSSPAALTGSLVNRVGVGWHPVPSGPVTLSRSSSVSYARYEAPIACQVDHVFRWPPGSPATDREFEGRMWSSGAGTYRPVHLTGQGPGLAITAEDMGS